MKKKNFPPLELWQFENLSGKKNIKHFVTDRLSNAGVSEFTLSLSSSPDKEFVRSNRRLLAQAMQIPEERLYFPSQIHKTKIVNVTSSTSNEELSDTDALITNERNICIAVMSADCVPILLFDQRNQAAAAIHAGWRGTVAKILTLTLHEMNRQFGTLGQDVVAGIGPSVSFDSYEVGQDVIEQVNLAFGAQNDLLLGQENKKAKLDLWKANSQLLVEAGVPFNAIEVSDLCTVKNNKHFFSARKGDTGRFAAGIMIVQCDDLKA